MDSISHRGCKLLPASKKNGITVAVQQQSRLVAFVITGFHGQLGHGSFNSSSTPQSSQESSSTVVRLRSPRCWGLDVLLQGKICVKHSPAGLWYFVRVDRQCYPRERLPREF